MDLFLAYVICFGVGLLFTIVSAFMADVFGGHDVGGGHDGAGGHAEAGFDSNDMPGFSPLSPTILAAVQEFARKMGMGEADKNGEPRRVLVVDDDRQLNGMLVELLHARGEHVDVDCAFDGFEAGSKVQAYFQDTTLVVLCHG